MLVITRKVRRADLPRRRHHRHGARGRRARPSASASTRPAEMPIYRHEIWLAIKEENAAAALAPARASPQTSHPELITSVPAPQKGESAMSLSHPDQHRGVRRPSQPASTPSNQLSKSMEKLSSGYRINKAADDAAGLAISEKLPRRSAASTRPSRTRRTPSSWCRPPKARWARCSRCCSASATSRSSTTTARCRPPTRPRSRPRSPSSAPRSPSIGTETKFNGIALLTGSATITFQVGANDGETIATVGASSCSARARATPIDSAIFNFTGSTVNAVVDRRRDPERVRPTGRPSAPSRTGSQHTLNNLGQLPGEPAGRPRASIKDVDMASEMVNFTKLQVLQQAGTAMLAQANSRSAVGAEAAAVTASPNLGSKRPFPGGRAGRLRSARSR